MRLDQRPERQGIETLHVTSAAAKILAIALDHRERVTGPGLPVHRHHIGVPAQHHPAFDLGAHMGKQRRLLVVVPVMAMTGDAMTVQIRFDPVDQRQVAVATDSWKAHQLFHQFERRKYLHPAVPLFARGFAAHGR